MIPLRSWRQTLLLLSVPLLSMFLFSVAPPKLVLLKKYIFLMSDHHKNILFEKYSFSMSRHRKGLLFKKVIIFTFSGHSLKATTLFSGNPEIPTFYYIGENKGKPRKNRFPKENTLKENSFGCEKK